MQTEQVALRAYSSDEAIRVDEMMPACSSDEHHSCRRVYPACKQHKFDKTKRPAARAVAYTNQRVRIPLAGVVFHCPVLGSWSVPAALLRHAGPYPAWPDASAPDRAETAAGLHPRTSSGSVTHLVMRTAWWFRQGSPIPCADTEMPMEHSGVLLSAGMLP